MSAITKIRPAAALRVLQVRPQPATPTAFTQQIQRRAYAKSFEEQANVKNPPPGKPAEPTRRETFSKGGYSSTSGASGTNLMVISAVALGLGGIFMFVMSEPEKAAGVEARMEKNLGQGKEQAAGALEKGREKVAEYEGRMEQGLERGKAKFNGDVEKGRAKVPAGYGADAEVQALKDASGRDMPKTPGGKGFSAHRAD